MLALATHEPNFRVLREDVFAQGKSDGPRLCHNCGKPGHITANCKGQKKVEDPKVVEKAKPVDPKPFIWLDVSILREYLRVELDVPQVGFPYDAELAIDDWIFMIFFVGNDFLPHLPSLEIREGAIDVLLKIWRNELPRMGGYLTNHGKVNLERCQFILDGIASREDGIFQKRKQDEERQNANQKRRRQDDHRRQDQEMARDREQAGTMTMNGQDYVAIINPANTARGGEMHPSLPERPKFDIVEKESQPARRPGKKMTYAEQAASIKAGLEAMSGSNLDVVKNRKAIRMANMSAAEKLKAELEGGVTEEDKEDKPEAEEKIEADAKTEEKPEADTEIEEQAAVEEDVDMPEDQDTSKKRKLEDAEEEADGANDDEEAPANPGDDHAVPKKKLKINPDGTVDYEDTVKLWEPGYRERYYRQKFGVELPDREFMNKYVNETHVTDLTESLARTWRASAGYSSTTTRVCLPGTGSTRTTTHRLRKTSRTSVRSKSTSRTACPSRHLRSFSVSSPRPGE